MILERHLQKWEQSEWGRPSISRAARCSAEINIELAGLAAGTSSDVSRIARHLLSLTPAGWYHFLRNSRIAERILARLRAKVIKRRLPFG
jgi:hypothetical protein